MASLVEGSSAFAGAANRLCPDSILSPHDSVVMPGNINRQSTTFCSPPFVEARETCELVS